MFSLTVKPLTPRESLGGDALRFAKDTHFQALLDQLAKKLKDGGLMKDMPPALTVGDADGGFGGFTQAQAPTATGFVAIEVYGG